MVICVDSGIIIGLLMFDSSMKMNLIMIYVS